MDEPMMNFVYFLMSLLVSIIGTAATLWTFRAQREETKKQREETERQREETKELTRTMGRVMTLEITTRKRFLEVKWLIRRSVAVLCMLVGLLALAFSLF